MKAITWPVVTTFGELKRALLGGFDLVQKPDSIMFALKQSGQYATPDKLKQSIAVAAAQSGWVMFCCPLPDGSRLYKLTTKAGE